MFLLCCARTKFYFGFCCDIKINMLWHIVSILPMCIYNCCLICFAETTVLGTSQWRGEMLPWEKANTETERKIKSQFTNTKFNEKHLLLLLIVQWNFVPVTIPGNRPVTGPIVTAKCHVFVHRRWNTQPFVHFASYDELPKAFKWRTKAGSASAKARWVCQVSCCRVCYNNARSTSSSSLRDNDKQDKVLCINVYGVVPHISPVLIRSSRKRWRRQCWERWIRIRPG